MAFLNFLSPSWRPDHYYLSFGTFRDHKNPKKVPKNTKKRSSNFYPFSLREMTTIHKNSYKTNKKTLPTPPNTLKVFHVYIGRPQKKKKMQNFDPGEIMFFYRECYQIKNHTRYPVASSKFESRVSFQS